MKSEFKAKLLQHVLNKKDSEKGFTLIELLVVIIIIGILAAIALPSFLNQANKAKQSEAKTYVGAMNKGQQAYFTEKNKFQPSDVSALGIGIKTGTTNYAYTTVGTNASTNITDNFAVNSANLQPGVVALKTYAGKVSLIQSGSTSDVTAISGMCETDKPGAAPTAPTHNDTTIGCAANTTAVGQ